MTDNESRCKIYTMFDASIIQKIIDYWNRHQERPHAGFSSKSAPKKEHIQRIIETVYTAGQKEVEGVQIRVRVSLLQNETINAPSYALKNIVLLFMKRQPLNVDNLVKIARAFDPQTTSVAVTQSVRSPDELEIFGVFSCSKRGRNSLDSVTTQSNLPDVFSVSVEMPGYLIISRADSIVCHFRDSKFYYPTPTPFHSQALGNHLHKIITTHVEFTGYANDYWHVYVDAMSLLLTESLKRGHGGTIIWLPQETLSTAVEFIQARYPVRLENDREDKLFQTLLRCKKVFSEIFVRIASSPLIDSRYAVELAAQNTLLLEAKRYLLDHLEFMSQLTCVDGALILTDRLQPLSFGSFLRAAPWTGNTLTGPDVFYNQLAPIRREDRGTRHNTAVDFVGACPGSVAFVISQDKLIAGMTRHDEKTIYWWPDCLSQMWEH